MKNDKLIPLVLNGKFDTIENELTYNHLQVSENELDSLIWEDMRKLIGEKIEILPDINSITGAKVIKVFGLEMTDAEEQSFYNSLNSL